MSTLKTTNLQHEASATPNIVLDNTGGTTIADANLTGDVDITADLNVTGDIQATSFNGGQLAGFRNKVINGDFKIWQRATSFTNDGSQQYTADRWKDAGNTVGAVVQQSSTAPAGFAYSLEADANAGSIQHGIELDVPNDNSQFPVGSTWTLSVWSDVNIISQAPIVRFRRQVGQSSGEIEASDSVPNWSSTGETSNGFTRYKSTFTITGDASTGTDIICLNFNLPGGGVGARRFAGCQLEPGPVPTTFEHRPIGTELALCQRYYFRLEVTTTGAVTAMPVAMTQTTGGAARGSFIPPTSMRTAPSLELGATIDNYFLTGAGSSVTLTSLTANTASKPQQIGMSAGYSGGIGNGEVGLLRFGADGSHLGFNAEL